MINVRLRGIMNARFQYNLMFNAHLYNFPFYERKHYQVRNALYFSLQRHE